MQNNLCNSPRACLLFLDQEGWPGGADALLAETPKRPPTAPRRRFLAATKGALTKGLSRGVKNTLLFKQESLMFQALGPCSQLQSVFTKGAVAGLLKY